VVGNQGLSALGNHSAAPNTRPGESLAVDHSLLKHNYTFRPFVARICNDRSFAAALTVVITIDRATRCKRGHVTTRRLLLNAGEPDCLPRSRSGSGLGPGEQPLHAVTGQLDGAKSGGKAASASSSSPALDLLRHQWLTRQSRARGGQIGFGRIIVLLKPSAREIRKARFLALSARGLMRKRPLPTQLPSGEARPRAWNDFMGPGSVFMPIFPHVRATRFTQRRPRWRTSDRTSGSRAEPRGRP
jgi:hypothetical protein